MELAVASFSTLTVNLRWATGATRRRPNSCSASDIFHKGEETEGKKEPHAGHRPPKPLINLRAVVSRVGCMPFRLRRRNQRA